MIEDWKRLHKGDILRNDWAGENNPNRYVMYISTGENIMCAILTRSILRPPGLNNFCLLRRLNTLTTRCIYQLFVIKFACTSGDISYCLSSPNRSPCKVGGFFIPAHRPFFGHLSTNIGNAKLT